jgi:hypothetical protein
MNQIKNFSHGSTRIITDENNLFLEVLSTMSCHIRVNPCLSVACEVLE